MSEHVIRAIDEEDKLMSTCEELRDEYHIETYEDFSSMCRKMAEAVEFMRYYNNAPMDHEEKMNLEYLSSALRMCQKMFTNCDEYYRR